MSRITNILMSTAGAPTIRTDEFFNQTTLLLSGDGTEGSQNNTFLDGSSNNFTITRNGNTTQGSYSPYGDRWSNYFDGTGDLLTIADNAALEGGSVDFTLEGWIYPTSSTAGVYDNITLFGKYDTGANSRSYTIGTGPNGNLAIAFSNTGSFQSAYYHVSSTTVYSILNEWSHLRLCRVGTTAYLFLNGSLIMSGAAPTTVYDGSGFFGIGGASTSPTFTGYISDVRFIKGTALSTSSFNPPTEPLTAVSGTSLLTCQSNRFKDNSANDFAITVNGDTKVTPFSPYAPATSYVPDPPSYQSVEFDGSGDYLAVPYDSSLAPSFGTSFTAECWLYCTSISSTSDFMILGQNNDSTGVWSIRIINQTIWFSGESGGVEDSGYVLNPHRWVHIAWVYNASDNSHKGFVNGTEVYSSTISSFQTGTIPFHIGARGSQWFFPGYISDVRVVDGTAVYTADFTPPTAPLEAIDGTSLLTCQDAFVDKSDNNFAITVNGNPQLTQLGPHARDDGYWANEFDGTGDYLTAPANAAFLFDADVTIEAWIWWDGTYDSGGREIYATGGSGSADQFGVFSSTGLYFGGVFEDIPSNYPPINQWSHVAATRSGTTVRLFINGVQTTSGTLSGSFGSSTTAPRVGYRVDNRHYWKDYISDLRIVKGTALYTSSFTPPTAPLEAVAGTSLLTCSSNRFIDKSANEFAITVNGDTQIAQVSPYDITELSSGGSGYFDGSGDYLSIANDAEFDLGSGDFTFEAWLNPNAVDGLRSIFNKRSSISDSEYIFFAINSGVVAAWISSNGSSWDVSANFDFGVNISTDRWTHIALVRNGNTITCYKNGVAGSNTITTTASISIDANNFNIGGDVSDHYFDGYIADFRLIKGTAVYTADFTPPTAPLSATNDTSLMLNFDNAGIYDATGKNVLETVGNAQIDTAVTKFGTGSMEFDGTGDGLIAPSSEGVNFGSGDFTIEAWVYLTTNSHTHHICSWRTTSGASNTNWILEHTTSGGYGFYASNGSTYIVSNLGNTLGTLNTWQHVAVTRNGSDFKMFIDGTQAGSTITSSGTIASTTRNINIGLDPSFSGNRLEGYIDDFRITKGVARYTANFTPPTKAFPTQ